MPKKEPIQGGISYELHYRLFIQPDIRHNKIICSMTDTLYIMQYL